MNDWQTPAALGVVILTVLIFAWRMRRSRKNVSGCGSGSCCDGAVPSQNVKPGNTSKPKSSGQ